MTSVSKLETRNSKLFLEDAVPRKVFLLAWRQQGCTTYYTETLVGKNRARSKSSSAILTTASYECSSSIPLGHLHQCQCEHSFDTEHQPRPGAVRKSSTRPHSPLRNSWP